MREAMTRAEPGSPALSPFGLPSGCEAQGLGADQDLDRGLVGQAGGRHLCRSGVGHVAISTRYPVNSLTSPKKLATKASRGEK